MRFVKAQGLPLPGGIRTFIRNSPEGVVVFEAEYGDPQDCPSGCFYSKARGIRRGSKIGWVWFEDYIGYDYSHAPFYNLDSTDTYLFSEALFTLLKQNAHTFYHYGFLQWMTADPDTPIETQLRIVDALVYDMTQPSVANMMIANPTVRSNCDVLKALSRLPATQTDSYFYARTQAQELLVALGCP